MQRSVTYLTTGLELGGAEMQLTALACGFARRGWRVQVVSMLPVDGLVLVDRLLKCGVPVVSLNLNPKMPDPRAIGRLGQIVRDFRSDVLHSHMVKANILGRLARMRAGVPVQISTAHNTIEGGRWVDWAYRLTDKFADVTTNVSQKAVDRYVAIRAAPAERIQLVRNGLDLGPFRLDDQIRKTCREDLGLGSAFVWIAVGRLTEQKDYLNMLSAFKKLIDLGEDCRLLIVGKGPVEPDLRRKIEELNLASSVALLGERRDVPELMAAADGYVMSSRWEGAPMVLLEAGASRLPVVATDVGGNRELVLDQKTGFIVPPRDPDRLGDAMMRIMRLPDAERTEMGESGRRHVEREYEMDRILDKWEALYEEVLMKRTATPRPS